MVEYRLPVGNIRPVRIGQCTEQLLNFRTLTNSQNMVNIPYIQMLRDEVIVNFKVNQMLF